MSRPSSVPAFWICFSMLDIAVRAQAKKKMPMELKRMKGEKHLAPSPGTVSQLAPAALEWGRVAGM